MKMFARVIAPLALVTLLAGCADDPDEVAGPRSDSSGSGDTGSSTRSTGSTGPTDPAPSSGKQAVSVTLRVDGGLLPSEEAQTFATGEVPPQGHSTADVRQVLELASDAQLVDLALTKTPTKTCCDLKTYRVMVRYDDGTSRNYVTLSGVQQPRLFDKFLSALS